MEDIKMKNDNTNEEIKGLDEDAEPETVVVRYENKRKNDTIVKKYLMISNVLAAGFEVDQGHENEDVVLSTIKDDVWVELKKYLEYRKGVKGEIIPFPATSKNMKDLTDEWSANFVDNLWKSNKSMVYDLIMTASYLDIQCLLHLLCCKVGTLIKGEPWEKISEIILPLKRLANTITPSEEKRE